ncbi:MAG: hypothetical protein ACRDBO_11615 [Lachnospiraceae bacterium]
MKHNSNNLIVKAEEMNVLLLSAIYLVIATILVSFNVVPGGWATRNRYHLKLAFSSAALLILIFDLMINKDNLAKGFLIIPLVTFLSSIYEIKEQNIKQVSYLQLSEGSYTVRVKTDLSASVSMLRNQIMLYWNDRCIMMPDSFAGKEGDLLLEYIKTETPDSYLCRNYYITGYEKSGFKAVFGQLIKVSVTFVLFIIPVVFYIGGKWNSKYFMSLGIASATYVIFGFVKILLSNIAGNIGAKIFKIVVAIYYYITLIGLLMAISGINQIRL